MLKDRLRDDPEIDIRLPGQGLLIYEDAIGGASWYQAGTVNGLTGDREVVAKRARTLAGTYARTYRQEWPLEEVDAKDGVDDPEADARARAVAEQQAREEAERAAVELARMSAKAAAAAKAAAEKEAAEEAKRVAEAEKAKRAAEKKRLAAENKEAEKAASLAKKKATDKRAKERARERARAAKAAEREAKEAAKRAAAEKAAAEKVAKVASDAVEALLDGASWEDVARMFKFPSEADARTVVAAFAQTRGGNIEQLEDARFGRAIYARRVQCPDWKSLAQEFSSSVNRLRRSTVAYARLAGRPWPLRFEAPDWGALAYKERSEKKVSWPTISATLGRDHDYIRKAAHEHAKATGKPWPIVINDDVGERCYQLRSQEGLSWEAIAERFDISKAWAIREARRHALTVKSKWPIPLHDVFQEAYQLRAQGHGWKEIRDKQGCNLGVAIDRARKYAAREGLPWPVKVAPVRTTHSPKAKAAYERGYVAKEPWAEVASSLGYRSVASCQNSAREYADTSGLPLDIVRRRGAVRDVMRPRLAYEQKAANPDAPWETIRVALNYQTTQTAIWSAKQWAVRNNRPWPIRGASHHE